MSDELGIPNVIPPECCASAVITSFAIPVGGDSPREANGLRPVPKHLMPVAGRLSRVTAIDFT